MSIFKNEIVEKEYCLCYEKSLDMFEMEYKSLYLPTSFGETHVLCFGDSSKQPLLLLHGMTMSSTMWYPNIKQLTQERCVYAVDVMGDFGKSKPTAVIKNKQAAQHGFLKF